MAHVKEPHQHLQAQLRDETEIVMIAAVTININLRQTSARV